MGKDEKLVAVEMTEQEKKDFAAFKLDQEEKKSAKKVTEQTVELDLRFQHEINNVKYGPGKTLLPYTLGQSLFVADDRALKSRLNETVSNKHIKEMISHGVSRTIKVRQDADLRVI